MGGMVRLLADPARSILQSLQIESVLIVPIIIDGRWWGHIKFDDCHNEREWNEAEVSILTAMGASVGSAIARRRSEAKLQHDSLHDPLTGLPNRALLVDCIEQCLDRADGDPDYSFSLLFIDLDRFKVINDSLGHIAGDQLLLSVAKRLENCVRATDNVAASNVRGTVARLGGDEFTILLSELDKQESASAVAQRVLTT